MHVNNLILQTSPIIVSAPGLHRSRKNILLHMFFNLYWILVAKN